MTKSSKRRHAGAIAAALPVLALLVALPFLLTHVHGVADARPAYVRISADMDHGAYLLTRQGAVQLYPWHLPLSELPSDSRVLNASQVRSLLVVARHPRRAEAYRLFRLGAGLTVKWHSASQDANQVLLEPGPLAPGGYLLTVPTDDLFGNKTYYYFRLK